MDARAQLLARLRAGEVGEEAIARAVESGCLSTFVVEVALGDGATHAASAVASAAALVAEAGQLERNKRRKRNRKPLDGRLRVYSYEPGSAS